MAIVVSHNEIISKERIIVTYHPIGKKKKIYSLFCLKKSGGCSPMSFKGGFEQPFGLVFSILVWLGLTQTHRKY